MANELENPMYFKCVNSQLIPLTDEEVKAIKKSEEQNYLVDTGDSGAEEYIYGNVQNTLNDDEDSLDNINFAEGVVSSYKYGTIIFQKAEYPATENGGTNIPYSNPFATDNVVGVSNKGQSLSAKQFVQKYKNDVIQSCKETYAKEGVKIFPSVKLAQMACETGWGKHAPNNNFFGIKASKGPTPYWSGEKTLLWTTECTPTCQKVQQYFRSYETPDKSISDHSYFLIKNQRYANNGVFRANTPEEQATALKKAGYATDPNYASTLMSIVNNYNLKSLDKEAGFA